MKIIKNCLICNNDFIANCNAQKYCVNCIASHRRLYKRKYYHKMKGTEEKPKRYSGLEYTNSKERLQEIKDKYKNGVTYQMIMEML